MLKREEIRIRDPFIYTDRENNCYYMYGTTALEKDSLKAHNWFSVYKTNDLENFEEPKVIFDGDKGGFWADKDFWAPELHKYNGSLEAIHKLRGEDPVFRGQYRFYFSRIQIFFVSANRLFKRI